MQKEYLILTDAPTFKALQHSYFVSEQVTFEARYSNVEREIRDFLYNHWKDFQEIHLYKKATLVGLDYLFGLKVENNDFTDVRAAFGQTLVILNTNIPKTKLGDSEKNLVWMEKENWENKICTLELIVVKIKKPVKVVEGSLEDFLND